MQNSPIQQTRIPVHTCFSIQPPTPFLLPSGIPLIPWQGWFVLLQSYLHLLEEELGMKMPDLLKNSLLIGLLGSGGHKQLARSPVIDTLQTAPFMVFAQSIAGYFRNLLTTANDMQD